MKVESREFINLNNFKPIELNSNILYIAELLQNLPEDKPLKWPKCHKERALEYGKLSFLNNNIHLHKIPFVSFDEVNRINKLSDGNLNYLLELFDKQVKKLHPFEVPVIFKDANIEYGESTPLYIGKDILKIIFSEFRITNKISILTPGIYAHEIVHSQLDSVKNSVVDYSNNEVLTLFFDKLTALNIDSEALKINELLRLKTIKKALSLLLNDDTNIFSKTYASMGIISLLKANNLFDKYIEGSNVDRRNIIESVQCVFDGIYPIENLLDKFDVSFKNSQDQRLIKKYL